MPVIAFLDEFGVGEEFVGQDDVGLVPVVVAERFEQAAVEERDAAFEAVAPRFVAAVGGQRVVEERFEDVVEEVVVLAVFAVGQPPQEIVRAGAPVLSLRHAEPAFLLEEVEEDDLAHELLGKVHGVDVLGLELVADGLVLLDEFFQRLVNVPEQLGILLEEFLGDGLDAEGFFDVAPAWGRSRCPGAKRETGFARCGSFRLRRRCRRNGGPA